MDQKIRGVLLGVAGVVLWFMPFTAWDTELFGVTMHFEHAGHDVGGVAYLLLFSSFAYAALSWKEEHTLRFIAASVAAGICVALYFKLGRSTVEWGLRGLFFVSSISIWLAIWDDRRSRDGLNNSQPAGVVS